MPETLPDAVYQLFVGVDIAAETATVAWQTPKQKPSKPLTIEQSPDGFSVLHQRLLKTGTTPTQTLVVLEATGSTGYPSPPSSRDRAMPSAS